MFNPNIIGNPSKSDFEKIKFNSHDWNAEEDYNDKGGVVYSPPPLNGIFLDEEVQHEINGTCCVILYITE